MRSSRKQKSTLFSASSCIAAGARAGALFEVSAVVVRLSFVGLCPGSHLCVGSCGRMQCYLNETHILLGRGVCFVCSKGSLEYKGGGTTAPLA